MNTWSPTIRYSDCHEPVDGIEKICDHPVHPSDIVTSRYIIEAKQVSYLPSPSKEVSHGSGAEYVTDDTWRVRSTKVAVLFKALETPTQQVQVLAEKGRGEEARSATVSTGKGTWRSSTATPRAWGGERQVAELDQRWDPKVGRLLKTVEDELANNKHDQIQPEFNEHDLNFINGSSAKMFNLLLNITTGEANPVFRRSLWLTLVRRVWQITGWRCLRWTMLRRRRWTSDTWKTVRTLPVRRVASREARPRNGCRSWIRWTRRMAGRVFESMTSSWTRKRTNHAGQWSREMFPRRRKAEEDVAEDCERWERGDLQVQRRWEHGPDWTQVAAVRRLVEKEGEQSHAGRRWRGELRHEQDHKGDDLSQEEGKCVRDCGPLRQAGFLRDWRECTRCRFVRSGCKPEICEGSWWRGRATESDGEHDVEMHGGLREEII